MSQFLSTTALNPLEPKERAQVVTVSLGVRVNRESLGEEATGHLKHITVEGALWGRREEQGWLRRGPPRNANSHAGGGRERAGIYIRNGRGTNLCVVHRKIQNWEGSSYLLFLFADSVPVSIHHFPGEVLVRIKGGSHAPPLKRGTYPAFRTC